jgi:hypothetical protein
MLSPKSKNKIKFKSKGQKATEIAEGTEGPKTEPEERKRTDSASKGPEEGGIYG